MGTQVITAPRGVKRTGWIALAAAVAVAGSVGAYQFFAADDAMPAGSHTVSVYTIQDQFTTPGADGCALLVSYHIKVDGAEQCVELDGSLGNVRATVTDDGTINLDATAVTALQGMVKVSDGRGSRPAARVLLEYDNFPAALVPVASIRQGGPVVATPVSH